MSQISPVPGQRTKIAVIVFSALALTALFIMWKHEGRVAQQLQQPPSPQEPQQQTQQSQESKQSLAVQRAPQEPQKALPPQQSQALQQSTRPQQQQQQLQEPQQSEEPQQSPESQEPHARAIADVVGVAALLDDYRKRNGVYPTTVEGMEALGIPRKKDPWGNDYIYQSPSSRGREAYDFFSPGPDHIPDTADDDWGGTEDPEGGE